MKDTFTKSIFKVSQNVINYITFFLEIIVSHSILSIRIFAKTWKCIGYRSGRNRTSRFISSGYLESYGRSGGGLCHNFVFLCHAYVSSVARIQKRHFHYCQILFSNQLSYLTLYLHLWPQQFLNRSHAKLINLYT